MTRNDIPTPTCATCGKSGSKSYSNGATSYHCENCGTDMRYMPAGELLNSGGTTGKENNGWSVSFSVTSSELYSGRAMFALGLLILILTLSFLWVGKIETDAALWSSGSGILLSVIGKRKATLQKKRTERTLDQYPYWEK